MYDYHQAACIYFTLGSNIFTTTSRTATLSAPRQQLSVCTTPWKYHQFIPSDNCTRNFPIGRLQTPGIVRFVLHITCISETLT